MTFPLGTSSMLSQFQNLSRSRPIHLLTTDKNCGDMEHVNMCDTGCATSKILYAALDKNYPSHLAEPAEGDDNMVVDTHS